MANWNGKEVALPHSPRALAFTTYQAVCMAYSLTDYAVLNLLTSAVTEVTIPAPQAVSAGMGGMGMGMGMGAFSGLFGAKAKPTVISVSDNEVLVNKDSKHDGLPWRRSAF